LRKPIESVTAAKIPGPGQYDLNKTLQPRFAMGIKPLEQKKLSVPGPGNYDLNTRLAHKAMPAFTLSGKIKDLSKDQIPGPGSYAVPEKSVEGP